MLLSANLSLTRNSLAACRELRRSRSAPTTQRLVAARCREGTLAAEVLPAMEARLVQLPLRNADLRQGSHNHLDIVGDVADLLIDVVPGAEEDLLVLADVVLHRGVLGLALALLCGLTRVAQASFCPAVPHLVLEELVELVERAREAHLHFLKRLYLIGPDLRQVLHCLVAYRFALVALLLELVFQHLDLLPQLLDLHRPLLLLCLEGCPELVDFPLQHLHHVVRGVERVGLIGRVDGVGVHGHGVESRSPSRRLGQRGQRG
mmetsp:Transcript_81923/g.206780  ORF Transcript_81923/g.206780 Transcript_81923/m.206780 type:complete len:262 (-) Transcript_81923:37-822(-)